uniref:Uncharacterized protein n=1 Tax=viral metagenome TaxID=1070528 RepID=A0A6M3LEI5_9ZZZZ
MNLDISIKIDGKDKGGLMGVSLEDIQQKAVIVKKAKKKKKRKTALMKAVESSIPAKSKYTTEVV